MADQPTTPDPDPVKQFQSERPEYAAAVTCECPCPECRYNKAVAQGAYREWLRNKKGATG